MDSKKRLQIAIENLKAGKKWTNRDIMEALGYDSPNYLSNMVSGKKEIAHKFLRRLEEELFISKTWIETGEGEMLIDSGAALDKLITGMFPKLSGKEARAFRTLLEIMAKIECAATKQPYRECLYGIFEQIAKAVST